MARKAKAGGGEGHGVAALRGNGFDSAMVKSFVERVENVQAQIDEITIAARNEIRDNKLREDINEIKKEAANAGIPRAELNAVLRRRRLLQKAEAVPSTLNDAQKENYDQLLSSLGEAKDLPLMKHVLDEAARNSSPMGVGSA